MHSEAYQDASLNRMLNVNEVSHILHVHSSTVRRWEKHGQLKSHRLGPKHNIRFKKEDISKFVDSHAMYANESERGNENDSRKSLTTDKPMK
jgi:excisionase family DNA binding protein